MAPFAVIRTTAGFQAAHDPNGNMILRVEDGVTYQQEWDAENRLAVVTNTVTGQVTRFVYDSDGNRILRVGSEGTTVYIGDYYEAVYPVTPPPCNPILNGDFSGGLFPWIAKGSASWDGFTGHDDFDEKGSARLGGGGEIYQEVTPGWTGLTLTLWARRAPAINATLRVQVIDMASGERYADQSFAPTGVWMPYQVGLPDRAAWRLIRVILSNSGSGVGTLWVDDVTFSCSGSIAPLQVTKYYYAGGQRVAVRVNGTLYFLHADHLGSATLTTDAWGNKFSEQRYFPYGLTRYGSSPTDRQFTGQRWDPALALYDYRARYYDPLLGRFISADPLVPEPGNPQALNRYAYVLNSPLNYTDPSGHALCLDEECRQLVHPISWKPIGGWDKQTLSPLFVPSEEPLAPLEPEHHPTGLPPLDWLIEPFLYIWPKVKLYENGARISTMLSDYEIEFGIEDAGSLLIYSPVEVGPLAIKFKSGRMWMEIKDFPRQIALGSISPPVKVGYQGVSMHMQGASRLVMSMGDRPGVLRVGEGIECSIAGEFEGVGSVRRTLYMRISTNIYGDRAAALIVDGALIYALVYIAGPSGAAAPLYVPMRP